MGDNESRDGGHCSESASERCTPRGPVSPVGGVWPGPPRAHCRQNIWKTPSQKIACADVHQGTGEKWASPVSFRRGYHADVNATPACLCSDPSPPAPAPLAQDRKLHSPGSSSNGRRWGEGGAGCLWSDLFQGGESVLAQPSTSPKVCLGSQRVARLPAAVTPPPSWGRGGPGCLAAPTPCFGLPTPSRPAPHMKPPHAERLGVERLPDVPRPEDSRRALTRTGPGSAGSWGKSGGGDAARSC